MLVIPATYYEELGYMYSPALKSIDQSVGNSVRSYLNRAIINHLYNHLPTEHVLS